ncbi:MAG: lipoyl synthase [Bacteroidota bacterium]
MCQNIIDKVLITKKPDWLRVKLPTGKEYVKIRGIVSDHKLHTICNSGNCPNVAECWGSGTATFMILGNICTRSCGFCAVATGKPKSIDPFEPVRVAKSIKLMNVKHCVITSVDRDDLKDGGSTVWAETVKAIRRINPGITIETLIPDFYTRCGSIDRAGTDAERKRNSENLQRIIDVAPEIVSHNLETVRRLTKKIRKQAKYQRSLEVLRYLKLGCMKTKSGIMLGFGETEREIYDTMDDLRNVGVDIFTLGQYLQPTPQHLPVIEFIKPELFDKYKEIGLRKGFRFIESGPLVRSSYHAELHL